MELVITLEAEEFARKAGNVALFAGKDKYRPLLTAVRFELDTGGQTGRFVATDSYGLCVEELTDLGMAPTDDKRGWNIPSTLVLAMVKACKREKVVSICLSDERAQLSTTGTTISDQYVIGDYPKWEHFIVKGYRDWDVGRIAIGSTMLARIAKIRGPGNDNKVTGYPVKIYVQDPRKPVVIEVGTALIVQMPVKVEEF